MLLERKIARAEDELKEAHEAQLQRLTQELMARATQSEKDTARNRDADAGEGAGGEGTVASERAYLMKGNRFDLRVRHTDPEVVRKLKLAKHLRRKKRMAEADEMQLEARTKNYEVTRAWYGEVRRQAQAKSAMLVKQQEMAMDTLKTKNESQLKSLQARYERDLANLHRLHEGQLRRARAISKSSNVASGVVSTPDAAAVADRSGKVSAARHATSPKPVTLDLVSDARAFVREKPVRPGSAAPRLRRALCPGGSVLRADAHHPNTKEGESDEGRGGGPARCGRTRLLRVCVRLHQLCCRAVGINQLQDVFVPTAEVLRHSGMCGRPRGAVREAHGRGESR